MRRTVWAKESRSGRKVASLGVGAKEGWWELDDAKLLERAPAAFKEQGLLSGYAPGDIEFIVEEE